MSELVTALRDGLKAGLIAARTSAGDRVESESGQFLYASPADAAGNLPKLCVYIVDDSADANANETLWDAQATIALEAWAYGVSDASAGKTGEEIAADRRDKLDGEAVRAIVSDPALKTALGIRRVRRVSTRRTTGKNGELIYGASKTLLEVDLFERAELCPGEDLFEEAGIETGVADADGQTDMTDEARISQEEP